MFRVVFRLKVLLLLVSIFVGVILFRCLDLLGVAYTVHYLLLAHREARMLCPDFTGGLGNLMFQYAAAYGIAKHKNMTVLVDAENELNHLFNLSAVVLPHVACWFLTTHTDVRSSAYDKETLNFSNDRDYQLKGYLQSWRYFQQTEPALRKIFRFQSPIKDEAEKVLLEAINTHQKLVGSKALTFIGVHIRRGDMLKTNFKNYGFNVASLDYIRKSMQYFNNRYHRILYLVCSNDMVWAKKYLSEKNVYFVESNSREVDMALMASCNHTIITVGSFGWWSAWLANGEVTHYRYPAARGSELRKSFSKEMTDYFYPGWIPLL